MPAEATIPNKTFNYHRRRNLSIPWQNQIHTISFQESSPSKDNKGKTPIQGQKLHPRKSKKAILQQTRRRQPHLQNTNFNNNITGSNNYFSLISINISGLNSPIKRHRLIDWLHKQDPTFCCLQETHLIEKDRHYLRVKT